MLHGKGLGGSFHSAWQNSLLAFSTAYSAPDLEAARVASADREGCTEIRDGTWMCQPLQAFAPRAGSEDSSLARRERTLPLRRGAEIHPHAPGRNSAPRVLPGGSSGCSKAWPRRACASPGTSRWSIPRRCPLHRIGRIRSAEMLLPARWRRSRQATGSPRETHPARCSPYTFAREGTHYPTRTRRRRDRLWRRTPTQLPSVVTFPPTLRRLPRHRR